MYPSRR